MKCAHVLHVLSFKNIANWQPGEKDGKGWKRMEKDEKGWKRMEKDGKGWKRMKVVWYGLSKTTHQNCYNSQRKQCNRLCFSRCTQCENSWTLSCTPSLDLEDTEETAFLHHQAQPSFWSQCGATPDDNDGEVGQDKDAKVPSAEMRPWYSRTSTRYHKMSQDVPKCNLGFSFCVSPGLLVSFEVLQHSSSKSCISFGTWSAWSLSPVGGYLSSDIYRIYCIYIIYSYLFYLLYLTCHFIYYIFYIMYLSYYIYYTSSR